MGRRTGGARGAYELLEAVQQFSSLQIAKSDSTGLAIAARIGEKEPLGRVETPVGLHLIRRRETESRPPVAEQLIHVPLVPCIPDSASDCADGGRKCASGDLRGCPGQPAWPGIGIPARSARMGAGPSAGGLHARRLRASPLRGGGARRLGRRPPGSVAGAARHRLHRRFLCSAQGWRSQGGKRGDRGPLDRPGPGERGPQHRHAEL